MTESEVLCSIIFITFSICVLIINRWINALFRDIDNLSLSILVILDMIEHLRRKRDKKGRYSK